MANRIVAVSEAIREELVEDGLPSDRINVIPNAIEIPPARHASNGLRNSIRSRYGIADNEVVLGYMGRLSEEKGLIYLIEAAHLLRTAQMPVKVLFIGDGPQRGVLEEHLRRRGLENIGIFTGFQPKAETFLPAMDIFVLPSLTEGTPMALLEAMAGGIPIIASAVGGIPKIISTGVNGMLVEPGDPTAIAAATRTLCGDPAGGVRMALAAKELVHQKFGVGPWIERFETLYGQTITASPQVAQSN